MVSGSSSIQVEIRRNVRDPNMVVVWAGVVMLALGLLIRFSSRPGSAER
jgi:cytochrome c biogenesis factor